MLSQPSRIVMKFGGTSVGSIERIERIAGYVKSCHQEKQILVVVSAMSGETDRLIGLAQSINSRMSSQEYDSIVSTGEQVSSSLMAGALQKIGVASRSFLGWQVPIVTNNLHRQAHIEHIDPTILIKTMEKGIVPVVAGFQGVTKDGRISTLGRGGSDTSAVAIASAIKADKCEIYTDVDGIYTTDPRIVPDARRIDMISYEEMLELSSVGAKVLHPRSVSLAMVKNIPVQVISSFDIQAGKSHSDKRGSLVVESKAISTTKLVKGIACTTKEALVSIQHVPDRPGLAARIFSLLASKSINVDMIVQSIGLDGTTGVTFTIPKTQIETAVALLRSVEDEIGFNNIETDSDIAKISIVGRGMHSHAGVASKMFQSFYKHGINIQVISTSEIKISVLVQAQHAKTAVRALHEVYELENV